LSVKGLMLLENLAIRKVWIFKCEGGKGDCGVRFWNRLILFRLIGQKVSI